MTDIEMDVTAVNRTALRRLIRVSFAATIALTAWSSPQTAPADDGGTSSQSREGTTESREQLSKEEKEQLNLLIESARKAYNAGNFEKAIPFLHRAYEIHPNPAFHYRIALSHERAGHPKKAIKYYEKFLEQKPDTSKRGQIEATLERLRQQTGASEGESKKQEPSPGTVFRWTMTGVAGASLISMTTFGLLFGSAKSTYEQKLQQARDQNKRRSETNLSTLRTRRNGRLTGFYVSLGLTLATGGLATYLWVDHLSNRKSAARHRPRPSVVVAPAPNGDGGFVGLRGRF